MEEEGASVTLAAVTKKPVVGMIMPAGIFIEPPFGLIYRKFKPQVTFNEVDSKNYDALVIAGGPSPEVIKLAENGALLDLIRDFDNEGKVIAAYALSSYILLNAGVLSGKEYTICKGCLPMYPEVLNALEDERSGAILDKDMAPKVVISGNVITGWGPLAMEEFSETLVEAIKDKDALLRTGYAGVMLKLINRF